MNTSKKDIPINHSKTPYNPTMDNITNNPLSVDNKGVKKPHYSFPKGVSGNPKGRPKKTIQQQNALNLIKTLAPDAARTLAKILTDDKANASDKIRAAEIILDRTYGKSPVNVMIENDNNTVINDIKTELEKIKSGIVITSGSIE